MEVYVVQITEVYDDPYEGGRRTSIDSVWSSLSKAQDRIKRLADDDIQQYKRGCGGDCESCFEWIEGNCDLYVETPVAVKEECIRVSTMDEMYTEYLIKTLQLDNEKKEP